MELRKYEMTMLKGGAGLMKERKLWKEILFGLVSVLALNWGERVGYYMASPMLLGERSDFLVPRFLILRFFPWLVVGGLWILWFICSAKANEKEKFEPWKDRLMIATLICALQWITLMLPSYLAYADERFFEYGGIVIVVGYLVVIAIIWAAFFIGKYVRKRKGAEWKEETLKQIKVRAVSITVLTLLQYLISCYS